MANQLNTIRIISGVHRSRKISFPANDAIRPTGDRVRETLFNWLQNDIAGAVCLDLFAGSGSLGIEALSRGAEQVVFVDKDTAIAGALSQNLELLQLDNGQVQQADSLVWLKNNTAARQFNIVFLDPPFNSELLALSCEVLDQSKLLAENCLLYIEQAHQLEENTLPSNWVLTKQKKAGNVFFYLFQRKHD